MSEIKKLITELSEIAFDNADKMPDVVYKSIMEKSKELFDKTESKSIDKTKADIDIDICNNFIREYKDNIIKAYENKDIDLKAPWYNSKSSKIIRDEINEYYAIKIDINNKEIVKQYYKKHLIEYKVRNNITPYGTEDIKSNDNPYIPQNSIYRTTTAYRKRHNELNKEIMILEKKYELMKGCRARTKKGHICKCPPKKHYKNWAWTLRFCNRHSKNMEERLKRGEHKITDEDVKEMIEIANRIEEQNNGIINDNLDNFNNHNDFAYFNFD